VTIAQITLLDPDDVKAAQLTCAKCAVSVNVLPESMIPEVCPSCNAQVSAGSKQALRHLQKFISEAKHEGALQRIQLVISGASTPPGRS
jgi:hypothetical protein